MKVVGLATPAELRIQVVVDEVFRVLTGREADPSAEAPESGDKLASCSSSIVPPAADEALQFVGGEEAAPSAKKGGTLANQKTFP